MVDVLMTCPTIYGCPEAWDMDASIPFKSIAYGVTCNLDFI